MIMLYYHCRRAHVICKQNSIVRMQVCARPRVEKTHSRSYFRLVLRTRRRSSSRLARDTATTFIPLIGIETSQEIIAASFVGQDSRRCREGSPRHV